MPNVQMPFGGSMQKATTSFLPSMNQIGNLPVAVNQNLTLVKFFIFII